jgi:hypothetical protein
MDSEWIVYDTDEFSYLGNHFRCDAPNQQVSNISIQNITENTAEINWNAPTHLNSIILIKEGSEVDFPPVSGTTYTGTADFNLANELGNGNKIVFASHGESVSISNLNSGTSYHIAAFAYDELGNCYNLDAAAASFTTEIAFDEDSEINNVGQPTVSSMLSTIDEESEAEEVFTFQITDLATRDTASTFIREMVFETAPNNTLAWESALNAILKDENGKISNAEINIVDDSITIKFQENQEYEIPSGESVDFKLAIWFNRFNVNDTQQFAVQIPAEHQFASSHSGSVLLNSLHDSIRSNEIDIIEAFDRLEDIRNGTNGITYVTTGYVSSNDFGIGNSQFYIQKDESTTYEQGISVFSGEELSSMNTGSMLKILGIREEVNGSIRLNADTVIVLNGSEILPQTYSITPSEFNSDHKLIGTRIKLDSMILNQPEFWGDFAQNVFQFSRGEDTVSVKIEPNNIYFEGNAQVPFGAVDLEGIIENRNDSVQLIVTLDHEIADLYCPVFTEDPQIFNIQSEQVDMSFAVNELSSVFYAVKKVGDSIPDLESLKNPQFDEQIISAGKEKIEIFNVRNPVSTSLQNLSSNTEYSVYFVAEDTVGNTNEIQQLNFFTLNAEADEDVEVVQANQQILSSEINAYEGSQDFLSVFNFTLLDGGTSDDLSTFVNQIVIHSSNENEASFNEVIGEVKLYDLSNDTVISASSLIFSDSIVFKLDEIFELMDGDSNTFQLNIKLKEEAEDDQNLAFEIPMDGHAWQVETYGSQLTENFREPVISSVHKIDVVATELKINHANEIYVQEEFEITINVEDENGNIDKAERVLDIKVDGEGELSGQTELNLVNGQGVFENLSFDQTGLFSFEITGDSLSKSFELNFIKPEIALDTVGFNSDFGLVTFPENSITQSYQLSAINLKDSILIKASEGFQLSINPDFTNETDSLILDNESFSEAEIYVQFAPIDDKGDFYQGNILHISNDADTAYLPVSGQEGSLNLTTIASARGKPIGERVKIQGIVTGGENQFIDNRIIQDETAGIVIQDLNSTLNFGDSVEVEGVLSHEMEWKNIIPEKEIKIITSDSLVVNPKLKSIGEINASVESQRVRIENLEIAGDGVFELEEYFIFNEDDDSLKFKLNRENHPLIGAEIPVGKINVTGLIGRKNETFIIYPEFEQDLEVIPRDTVLIVNAPAEGLSFGNVLLDEYSEVKTYSLKAENLPENLKISVSNNFEISLLENSNYTNELELPINERGDIPEISVYTRFSPVTAKGGELNGEILHVSGRQEKIIQLKGIEEVVTSNYSEFSNKIMVYPNPVNSKLKIELLESGDYLYQLISADGEIILVGKLQESKVLKLDGIVSGIYIFKISNDHESYQLRIIKE